MFGLFGRKDFSLETMLAALSQVELALDEISEAKTRLAGATLISDANIARIRQSYVEHYNKRLAEYRAIQASRLVPDAAEDQRFTFNLQILRSNIRNLEGKSDYNIRRTLGRAAIKSATVKKYGELLPQLQTLVSMLQAYLRANPELKDNFYGVTSNMAAGLGDVQEDHPYSVFATLRSLVSDADLLSPEGGIKFPKLPKADNIEAPYVMDLMNGLTGLATIVAAHHLIKEARGDEAKLNQVRMSLGLAEVPITTLGTPAQPPSASSEPPTRVGPKQP